MVSAPPTHPGPGYSSSQTQRTATLCKWQPPKATAKPCLEKAQMPRKESAACHHTLIHIHEFPCAASVALDAFSCCRRSRGWISQPPTMQARISSANQHAASSHPPVMFGLSSNPNRTTFQLISRSGHGLGSRRPLSPHFLHGKAGQMRRLGQLAITAYQKHALPNPSKDADKPAVAAFTLQETRHETVVAPHQDEVTAVSFSTKPAVVERVSRAFSRLTSIQPRKRTCNVK